MFLKYQAERHREQIGGRNGWRESKGKKKKKNFNTKNYVKPQLGGPSWWIQNVVCMK